jgi:alanyl-tRNA synthetase
MAAPLAKAARSGDVRRLVPMTVETPLDDAKASATSRQMRTGVDGVVQRGTVWNAMPMQLDIDAPRREAIRKNHTATHLLHAALRQILGEHVKQAGSLVAPDRLRFDFTHFTRLSERELDRIESLVNEQIWTNTPLQVVTMDLDSAISWGPLALFGEKYGEEVRTIEIKALVRNSVAVRTCGPPGDRFLYHDL